ncbi:MAG: hypothetical protein CVT73_21040 [Alphaproteobacteria bacterium HGW-Alphaproteobacteria-12]|nr:MAG: hypothetical protein CVT73_21040 [Alphaproteobacteria bacterium HGW-Alphaproteobacteria-12]
MRFLGRNALLLAACLCMAAVSFAGSASAGPWRITEERWSASDEKAWQDFVAALGAADCWTFDACIKSPANPYRHTDPKTRFYVDCADMPYVLRAYFAWKNGLPFAWQTAMKSGDGPGTDIRYSQEGNIVVGRGAVPRTPSGVNALSVLRGLTGTVSTAMYRRNAASDDAYMFTDTYSPRLDREAIVPGTIAYDVNGHVSLVWRVEPGGRVLIFSSHPDHSLSRGFLGKEFLRTGPQLGSIFQKFRPIAVVGAKRASNGALTGGKIVGTRNAGIPDFSLEQYAGSPPGNPYAWRTSSWLWNGENMDFYTYLRARLSAGELEYRPVAELRSMMQSICFDLRSRKQAVEISVGRGIQNMTPPERLPRNIYGTDGVWELYSTPSRDARLKTAFKEMYDLVVAFIDMDAANAPRLRYDGSDLAGDLLAAWGEQNAACDISYVNSDGRTVALSIERAIARLYDLSFDPYHCVERRWGAPENSDGEESASCRDGALKTRWYKAERTLRNQIDRTYDVDMGYSISELERGPWGLRTGKGVEEGPEVDVKAYLTGLVARRDERRAEIANPFATP